MINRGWNKKEGTKIHMRKSVGGKAKLRCRSIKIYYPVMLLMIIGCVLMVGVFPAVSGVMDVCSECAYTTVQGAVDAIPDGLTETITIRVARGTYSGKTVISASKKIRIEGGWDSEFANRSDDASLTVLQHSAFGIVTALADAGEQVEVTIENLKLTGAFSSDYHIGGGISASANNGGTITLSAIRCLVADNSASHGYGIGIGLQSIGAGSLITFSMDSTLVTHNTVTFYSGGGLYLEAYDSGIINANITNSVITNNSAMYGGGIGVGASYPGCCPNPFPLSGEVNLHIMNSTITDNLAWQYSYYGGGYGGGLLLSGGYGNINATIVNSILWGNNATLAGEDIYSDAVDSYSGYGNGASIVNVSYSDIGSASSSTGGIYNAGNGVVSTNPLFVDSSGGDYYLTDGSPMIDAGTSSGAPSYDFDGTRRPSGNGIDMGAYEVPAHNLTIITSGTGTGKVTSDPAGIDCGNDCKETYTAGTLVTLTATPGAGSGFAGWSGACTGIGSCVINMIEDVSVTAIFQVPTFTDVPADHWAFGWIEMIYVNGITTGYADGTYRPSLNVIRAQMAAFIIKAKYGDDFSYSSTPYFSDVPAGHWAFKYIQKMYEDGITTGYSDGTYRPAGNVTRGQMAAFIVRGLYGEDFTYNTTPYFSDVAASHGSFKYIQKVTEEGIASGYSDGTYRPSQNVNRAQMAAFIGRAFLGMA
jgi:hypothetical protein